MTQMIAMLIPLAAAIWVGQDAGKRGMNPWGWGIGTFLILIIILPVYLLTRKPLIDNDVTNVENDVLD